MQLFAVYEKNKVVRRVTDMKKLSIGKKCINIIGIVLVFGLVWGRTFMEMTNNYMRGTAQYAFLVILTIGITAFYYWVANDEESNFWQRILGKDSAYRTAIITEVICLIMFSLLIVEIYCSDFSVYSCKEIVLWGSRISKRYIFEIFVIIIFPILVKRIFETMKKAGFSSVSVIAGSVQIATFSVIEYLLFAALYNIWSIELAIINIVVVVAAVEKYAWKGVKQKGNLITLVALYAILWIVILGLRSTGESFSQYMYAGDWDNYVENVRCLMSNASFRGTSETLRGMEHIHEFLLERNNYLFTILYYGGWSFVFLFLLYAALFLIVLAKMLGFSNRNIHKNHLIFTASFWVLAVRTLLGVLYTFAIIPYPVSLPFAGKAGIITDSLAFALLLICSYENRKIVEMLNYKVVPIANVFPGDNEFEVFDEETMEQYNEEVWMDTVIVTRGDEEIRCLTEWITHEDHDFVVFDYGEGVFILEHSQEGAWHTVEDEKIINEVFAQYLRCIKPVYIEVDYEED